MLANIAEHRFALTPGRYVGSSIEEDQDEPFEERFPALTARLRDQFMKSQELMSKVKAGLSSIDDGV
jgi:type I restriction enzyme M protein